MKKKESAATIKKRANKAEKRAVEDLQEFQRKCDIAYKKLMEKKNDRLLNLPLFKVFKSF